MHQLIALVPGLIFLIALWQMDSFKLVRRASIGGALTYGALAALACEALHGMMLATTSIDSQSFARYVAPVTEETAKALLVVFLIVRRRIGFLVDAAILGFAVGTGFAIVENATYLRDLGDAPLMLWVIRGLGTGVLHGATTAISGIIGKAMVDRRFRRSALAFAPGWAFAIVIHSVYNHLLVSPVVAAVLMLFALPVVVLVVFERSERTTREWLGAGLDLDLELLQLLTSQDLPLTRLGRYLTDLRVHFDGRIVNDMFCLLRLELELAVQAKALLMVRRAGLDIPADEDLRYAVAEWAYLRQSIGPTGLLSLEPLRLTSDRDEWHRHLLSQAGVGDRLRHLFRRVR